MKVSKRIAAAILSVCMVVTSMGMQVEASNKDGVQPESVKAGHETGKEELEGFGEEELEQAKTQQMGQEAPKPDSSAQRVTEDKMETGTLNFIMEESGQVQTPGVQNVVASLGEDGSSVENASLLYRNVTTGQELTTQSAAIAGNMVRFSMEYQDEASAGVYELTSLSWEQGGKLYQAALADLGMQVQYGVNQQIEAEPDEVLLDKEVLEEVEENVVTMDENGNPASESTVENILGKAEGGSAFSRKAFTKGAKNMVIVLDPGHDSTHSGANYHGYKEQDLVLKIALYCREELKKYAGATIYMTRDTQSCPNGGAIVDTATCNAKRVELAAAKGADVYVSFHLNASPSSSANGVGVYYPNSNYRPAIGEEGKGLATEIYKKLAALGLSTWASGILIRNSETNTQYPDGSLADYLAVIRRSKLAGFPAVLIEHAFLSNSGDVSKFLNSDTKLKNLGIADAKGIVNYYGLVLKGNEGAVPEISTIQSRNSRKLRVNWNEVADAVSYQVHRSNTVDGAYTQIASATGNKYDDSSAEPGKVYYYKVCAVYQDGKTSGFSSAHSGRTLVQPKITKAACKSSTEIELIWSGVENAAKYEVLRSETGGDDYKKIATVKSDKVTYLDKSVASQKTYYYKIRARGGEGNGSSDYSSAYASWAVMKTKILSVASNNSTALEITWKQIPNASGYRIQRSTSKNKGYKTIATVNSGGTTSYIDKKLKTGKAYYYKVQAMNKVNKKTGYSGYCKQVSGKAITGTSMEYVRSKTSTSMEVKWKKDKNATGYRLKRSTAKNGTYQVVANISKNSTVSYVDKTISSGKKYYYAVESVIEKNGVKHYSTKSSPISARNIRRIVMQSMEMVEEGLTLNWEEVLGANGYQIMRSESKSGPFTQIAKLGPDDDTSYTDTKAQVGKRYYYKVRGIRTGKHTGYGSYSKVMEKWALAAPEDLTATPVKPDKMKLSWGKVPEASGYEIFRSIEENGAYDSITTLIGSSVTTYTDEKLLQGTVYYYKVSAIGDNGGETGNGDETPPVSAQINKDEAGNGDVTPSVSQQAEGN